MTIRALEFLLSKYLLRANLLDKKDFLLEFRINQEPFEDRGCSNVQCNLIAVVGNVTGPNHKNNTGFKVE